MSSECLVKTQAAASIKENRVSITNDRRVQVVTVKK